MSNQLKGIKSQENFIWIISSDHIFILKYKGSAMWILMLTNYRLYASGFLKKEYNSGCFSGDISVSQINLFAESLWTITSRKITSNEVTSKSIIFSSNVIILTVETIFFRILAPCSWMGHLGNRYYYLHILL